MSANSNLELIYAMILIPGEWVGIFVFFVLACVFVVGVRILLMFREHVNWVTIGIRFCFGVLPLLACLTLFALVLSSWGEFERNWNLFGMVTAIVCGLGAGLIFAYLTGRFVEPNLIELSHSFARPAGLPEQVTDIREVAQQFDDVPKMDFENMFAQARKRDEICLGQRDSGEPVVVDRKIWNTSHVQIMGPPGTGKGIQAGITLTQSLLYGDAVFVFDPKYDEWGPSVYRSACERASVSFEFVNLREPFPQINPILNASAQDVEEMLYAGFELGRRGDTADFYRLDDRKAARVAASFVVDSKLSLAEIGSKAKSLADDELMTGGKAFFAAIDE